MKNYNGEKENKKSNEKNVKIFTKKLALELRRKGFDIVGTEPNFKKPQFDVYLFRDTDELKKAMTSITKANSKKKEKRISRERC